MYYKLLVKRLVKNINEEPLKNEDGTVVTEDRKVTGWKDVLEGDPPVRKIYAEEVIGKFPVIPKWILNETFTLYQKIENNSHVAYFTEKGEPFSLESHNEVFESEIIETNVIPPFTN